MDGQPKNLDFDFLDLVLVACKVLKTKSELQGHIMIELPDLLMPEHQQHSGDLSRYSNIFKNLFKHCAQLLLNTTMYMI